MRKESSFKPPTGLLLKISDIFETSWAENWSTDLGPFEGQRWNFYSFSGLMRWAHIGSPSKIHKRHSGRRGLSKCHLTKIAKQPLSKPTLDCTEISAPHCIWIIKERGMLFSRHSLYLKTRHFFFFNTMTDSQSKITQYVRWCDWQNKIKEASSQIIQILG